MALPTIRERMVALDVWPEIRMRLRGGESASQLARVLREERVVLTDVTTGALANALRDYRRIELGHALAVDPEIEGMMAPRRRVFLDSTRKQLDLRRELEQKILEASARLTLINDLDIAGLESPGVYAQEAEILRRYLLDAHRLFPQPAGSPDGQEPDFLVEVNPQRVLEQSRKMGVALRRVARTFLEQYPARVAEEEARREAGVVVNITGPRRLADRDAPEEVDDDDSDSDT